MDKPDEIGDVNNLSNLTQDELKKKVLEWIRGNGISEKLHSQLRCDLISSFNKTHLGRYIESQFQSEYRMILSPVILSLNTLVAEFLYAQNCHYSLSVFSTEMPFKNTLPEFEKRDHFRFTKAELNEIFHSLGIESKHFCDNISSAYYKNNNKGNNSLLLFIFQTMFNKKAKNSKQTVGFDTLNLQETPLHDVTSDYQCTNCRTMNLPQENNNLSVYKKNLKYVNKYLYISIRKIYKLAKKIDKLELTNLKDYNTRKDDKMENKKSPNRKQHKDLENLLVLNKSLENLTNEFKQLMNVEKINKDSLDYNFVILINDVIRITNSLNDQFETCNQNVSLLLKHVTENSKLPVVIENKVNQDKCQNDNIKETNLCYKDWLESVKASKHGTKFLKKLESNFSKTLLKEKQQMTKDFQDQLEKEKLVIKLHYRQKYLQHLTKRSEQSRESETQINTLQGFIEQNTKFIEHSDRVLQELDKKSTIQDNTNTETEPNDRNSSKRSIFLSQHPVYSISIEPIKLDEITQTIVPSVQFDHHAEDVVLDTRKRIFELDRESELLDQSFQNYLQRQITEKSKYKIDISKIWHKYHTGRVVLNSKNYSLISNRTCDGVFPENSGLPSEIYHVMDTNREPLNINTKKMEDLLLNGGKSLPIQEINCNQVDRQKLIIEKPIDSPKLGDEHKHEYSDKDEASKNKDILGGESKHINDT